MRISDMKVHKKMRSLFGVLCKAAYWERFSSDDAKVTCKNCKRILAAMPKIKVSSKRSMTVPMK